MDIPSMLQGVTWVAVDEPHCQRIADDASLPHVTHEGVFEIMGHKIKCFRLSTGQAVFEKDDFERFCEAWFGSAKAAKVPK